MGKNSGNKHFGGLLYKYNILERVLVENSIPRNVIINRGAAEVDNHISRDDFFRLAPSQECSIYFIIPNIIPYFYLLFFPVTLVREVPRTAQSAFATNG